MTSFILYLLTTLLQISDKLYCLKTFDSNLTQVLPFLKFVLTILTFDLVHKLNFPSVKDHQMLSVVHGDIYVSAIMRPYFNTCFGITLLNFLMLLL